MAAETVSTNELGERREELKRETNQLLVGAAALAGYILEEAASSAYNTTTLQEGGYLQLPGIVLPGVNTFFLSGENQSVPRRVVNSLMLRHNRSSESGDGSRVDVPDSVRVISQPLALGVAQFDDKFMLDTLKMLDGSIRPVIWAYRYPPQSLRYGQDFPYKSPCESNDWEAFTHYPAEALTSNMADWHQKECGLFRLKLEELELALEDTTLNPRPAAG